MLKNFQSYQLAVVLYQECKLIKAKPYIVDQLCRAGLSVALNLAEGCAKPTNKERRRFYSIAMASLREVQAIIDIESYDQLKGRADRLGGMIFKLVKNT